MLVYAFRAGRSAGEWTDTASAAEIVEYCRRFGNRWLEQDAWFFEDLPIGAHEFVETTLVVRCRTQSRFVVTHTHATREKLQPNTVFVGVLENEEYRRQSASALEDWSARQTELRRKIELMAPLVAKPVYWKDLPDSLKARCRGTDLSPDECWIWRPLEHLRRKDADSQDTREAPYRAFYARVKGPVPSGIVLRHKCDNRTCLNPNHLEPGTPGDNVQDMMKRGRHPAQVREQARVKWRLAYHRRKELKLRQRLDDDKA